MRRDFLHVTDAVDAYLHLAEHTLNGRAAGEAFNFSDERPLTVMAMYEEICSAVGSGYVEPEVLARAQHEIPDQYLDSRKATDVLGWSPKTGLASGLEQTAEWYRSYGKRQWQTTTNDL
jgi:CDP-glucose 4,6-dehydratase